MSRYYHCIDCMAEVSEDCVCNKSAARMKEIFARRDKEGEKSWAEEGKRRYIIGKRSDRPGKENDNA